MACKCLVCGKAFYEGEYLQAFLRCPDDPEGSWTKPVEVDSGFQGRFQKNPDKIKRKHRDCKEVLPGIRYYRILGRID